MRRSGCRERESEGERVKVESLSIETVEGIRASRRFGRRGATGQSMKRRQREAETAGANGMSTHVASRRARSSFKYQVKGCLSGKCGLKSSLFGHYCRASLTLPCPSPASPLSTAKLSASPSRLLVYLHIGSMPPPHACIVNTCCYLGRSLGPASTITERDGRDKRGVLRPIMLVHPGVTLERAKLLLKEARGSAE